MLVAVGDHSTLEPSLRCLNIKELRLTPTAFYQPEVDPTGTTGTDVEGWERFTTNEPTGSPWGPNMQHGGPVAALMARAVMRYAPRAGHRLSRISVDLLGPVPMGVIRTRAYSVRQSRNTELLRAIMEAPDAAGQWNEVAHGHGWRLATSPTRDVTNVVDAPLAFTPPTDLPLPPPDFSREWPPGGFVDATNWLPTQIPAAPTDDSVAWIQLPRDLVAGEPITELERLMVAADTANGVGARLDPAQFAFLNPELTVHLHHQPAGEWFGVQAVTTIGPDGIGMSQGILHATTGPIGRVTQTVLVQRR